MSKLDKFISELGIDETFTKPIKKPKKYTKVKDVVTQLEGYNYMADLLYLPQDEGYKYLLVVIDLVTHAFDFEPIKERTAVNVLDAMKKIFKRKILKMPEATIRTDNGSEFKGVFHKYLYDNNIFHSVSLPYRHSQLSAVEAKNKILGRIINGYMNTQEMKTGEKYTKWVHILPILRKELNKIYYIKPKYTVDTINKEPVSDVNTDKQPKFKVGDLVHRQLDYPENALMQKQTTSNFRMGDMRYDRTPKKIINILYYDGAIPYRYMIDGIKNASFTEDQLLLSNEKEQKHRIKKIIGKKKIKGKVYYLIWWVGYTKKNATWEPKTIIMQDAPKLVKEYEESIKD